MEIQMSETIKIRCSSLPRLAACPGSLKACEGIPSKSSAVSEMGTQTHQAIEDHFMRVPCSVVLDDRQQRVSGWFIYNAEEIIASHGGARDVYPELQLSGIIADGFEITGKPDLIVLCNDGKWLLFDWKCGFAEVPKAAANIQLMGYAWLLSTNEGICAGIEAYLFNAGGDRDKSMTGTSYDRDSIGLAKCKLTDIVQSAVLRDVRNPGDDQCKYCQAKCSTRCPETLESLTMPPIVRECLLPENKEEAAALRKAAKSFIALAESYIDRIDAEVRAYPEEWAGQFVLQSTGSTRKIESAQEAYRVIVEENAMLSAEQFLGLVSVPIGKLEAALKEPLKDTGVPVKDHKAFVAALLGDNLKSEEKAMSVKAVSK
jgi:hypothetical protein